MSDTINIELTEENGVLSFVMNAPSNNIMSAAFLEKFEAGAALLGTEVKSIQAGRIQLKESYVQIKDGEVWLFGSHISHYSHGNINNHDVLRPRKLLLHRKEIENHSWWLISTVFLIMMPALARGIQFAWIGINFSDWPNVNIMTPVYIGQGLLIGMIVLAAWKFGTLRHPATYIAIGVNLFVCLQEIYLDN